MEKLIIDCNRKLKSELDYWEIAEHKKTGSFCFDPIKLSFYRSKKQTGRETITSSDLYEELRCANVVNANVLDFLLKNPHLIPDEWKEYEDGKKRIILFWGTIYKTPAFKDIFFIRTLYSNNGEWTSNYHRTDWALCERDHILVFKNLF